VAELRMATLPLHRRLVNAVIQGCGWAGVDSAHPRRVSRRDRRGMAGLAADVRPALDYSMGGARVSPLHTLVQLARRQEAEEVPSDEEVNSEDNDGAEKVAKRRARLKADAFAHTAMQRALTSAGAFDRPTPLGSAAWLLSFPPPTLPAWSQSRSASAAGHAAANLKGLQPAPITSQRTSAQVSALPGTQHQPAVALGGPSRSSRSTHPQERAYGSVSKRVLEFALQLRVPITLTELAHALACDVMVEQWGKVCRTPEAPARGAGRGMGLGVKRGRGRGGACKPPRWRPPASRVQVGLRGGARVRDYLCADDLQRFSTEALSAGMVDS